MPLALSLKAFYSFDEIGFGVPCLNKRMSTFFSKFFLVHNYAEDFISQFPLKTKANLYDILINFFCP
jgi:hypothetical protein